MRIDVRIVRAVFGRIFPPMVKLLSDEAIRQINVFTVIETVVLTVWLVILVPSLLDLPIGQQAIAAVVLLVGLEIEHLTAGVSGKV